jgi:Protein of unknown function (DUF1353)
MTSRRRFLKIGGAGLILGDVFFKSGRLEALAQGTQVQRSAEEWMDAWMNAPTRGEQGALYLSRFVEPIYFLTKPITWTPNPDQHGYQPVTVPVGFVTDLASIPRLFWSSLRPDGEYTYPAIVHDYLYWTQTRPKDTADMIFKFGMQDFDINWPTIVAIYEAVHLGGGPSWKHNQELKLSGERHLLKELPNDPKARWADWKNKRELFFPEK